MKLKNSKYNYFTMHGDVVILYNFLFKNMIEFSLEEFEEVRNILNKNIITESNRIVSVLNQNMFLVDLDFNELEYFKYNYYKSLYNSSVFKNTVLPTLSCNLECPYCYEYKRNISMDDKTINAYISWVTPFLADVKNFYIDWFGGEPLLRLDIIAKITDKIYKVQEDLKFNYCSSITTNGVLMSKEIIKKFEACSIEGVQVTFDGDMSYHNQYRKTTSKNDTFNTLMENVNTYCEFSRAKTALVIRVNVTDENFTSIETLLDRFTEKVKKRSVFIFRWIYESSAANFRQFSNKRRGLKPFENLSILYQLAIDKGCLTLNLDEHANFNFCECDFTNHYTIDPEGNVYLCTQSFDVRESIGTVFKKQFELNRMSFYYTTANINPFNNQDCLECKLLPMCKGGCRKAAYLGKRMCIEQKDSIDKYLEILHNKYARC